MDIDLELLFKQYGTKGLFFGIIILLIQVFKSFWISDFGKKTLDKVINFLIKIVIKSKKIDNFGDSIIINHDIFNHIDLWCYSRIPTIDFGSEFKNQLFRNYLTLLLKSYKRGLINFISKEDWKKMDKSEFKRKLLAEINLIIYDYETKSLEIGIPYTFISVMKARNNNNNEVVYPILDNLLTSDLYDKEDNYLKLYSILNVILSYLDITINKSNLPIEGLSELNIKKITIRGKEYKND